MQAVSTKGRVQTSTGFRVQVTSLGYMIMKESSRYDLELRLLHDSPHGDFEI